MRQALELALEALQFALHVGFPESSESQIKKSEKASQQHRAAITAIKEALAQPEQEPVPTLDDLEQEIYENTRQFVSRDIMEWMLKRYYTTPPQRTWVGLTDEEKQEWIDAMPYDPQPRHCMIVVNVIEVKLKEKNT